MYDALFGLCPLVEIRGDLAEAESLGRDLLKVSKVWFGVESPSTAAALGRLAGVLISSNRAGEADQLFAEFSPTGFLDTPANGPSLKVRANLLARQGKWSGAEADATLAVKTVPLDFECRHLLAAILVARGKRDELRLNCQTMLDGFGGTSTAIVASRLALDCLVLPAIAVNASSVGGLVETGILGKMEGNWMNYAQCTKALWDYRQGHFAGAIAWSQRSVQSLSLDIRVMSFSVLAMAHFQIGEHTLARSFLSEGAMLVKTRYPKPDRGDLGAEWKEGIQIDLGSEWKGGVFARALLEEAQVLIEPRQKSGL